MQIGQVVWMKCKLQNNLKVTKGNRPYIVMEINTNDNYIEFGPLSSIEDDPYLVLYRSNYLIKNDNPRETVIRKHSIVQMDNPIQIEMCNQIKKCRSTTAILSEVKLYGLMSTTEEYRNSNELDEMRCVYVTSDEFIKWNPSR